MKSTEPLSSNCVQNITQNEQVFAICCRPEVDDDVVSGVNVSTVTGFVVVNFEVASSSGLRYIKNSHLETAEAAAVEVYIGDSIKRPKWTSINENPIDTSWYLTPHATKINV